MRPLRKASRNTWTDVDTVIVVTFIVIVVVHSETGLLFCKISILARGPFGACLTTCAVANARWWYLDGIRTLCGKFVICPSALFPALSNWEVSNLGFPLGVWSSVTCACALETTALLGSQMNTNYSPPARLPNDGFILR